MKNDYESDKTIETKYRKSYEEYIEPFEQKIDFEHAYKDNQTLIKNLIYQKSALIEQQIILQKENNDLKEKIISLDSQKSKEIDSLNKQLTETAKAYNDIKNSHFWGITLPFQRLIDLFHKKRENKEVLNTADENSKVKLAELLKKKNKINILATKHTNYIAKLLKKDIEKLGIVTLIIEDEPKEYEDCLYIVVCPQMFKKLPKSYIAYQMEQTVSSRWFTEEYDKRLANAYAIFDYSINNIEYFKKNNKDYSKNLYYVPIDSFDGFEINNESYEYDVAFYGDPNSARRNFLLQALKKNFKVKIISEVFGDALYKELSKAKVIVNLHYYKNALLETTRLYETLSLGRSIIVSEKSKDVDEDLRIQDKIDFVDTGDVNELVEHIKFWLENEDERIKKVKENNGKLKDINAFTFFFYRFLLAEDVISFDSFYDLAGSYISFKNDRICLSLPEDVERRKSFDKENEYNFEYFPALRHSEGWVGCGMSYKFIMKKAKEQQFDSVTVCEDDVLFPENFKERYKICLDYLEKNKSWNVFQGLMADLDVVEISDVEKNKGNIFVSLNRMISMVFNTYRKEVYDLLIDWDETNRDVQNNTIDRALENINLKIITVVPFLVGHKEELTSSIWKFNNSQYSPLISESESRLKCISEKYLIKKEKELE